MANSLDTSVPDTIEPSQFFAHTVVDTPEKRLLFAILDDAISSATRRPSVLEARREEHAAETVAQKANRKYDVVRRAGYRNTVRQEALDWIASDDHDTIFCFVSICHVFDLNPEAIRDALKKRTTPIPAMRLRPGGMQLPQIGSARQRYIG